MSSHPFLARLGTAAIAAGGSFATSEVHALEGIAPPTVIRAETGEVRGANYLVRFDPSEDTIHFEGVLRLDVSEYDPIAELLDLALKKGSDSLTLKLVDLTFLNSSGLNVLYKFAISARKQGDTPIVVRAAKNVPWQVKSLPNLKKFNRNIEVVFDD